MLVSAKRTKTETEQAICESVNGIIILGESHTVYHVVVTTLNPTGPPSICGSYPYKWNPKQSFAKL